jgi:20S proteasome alpha/beta subunit
MGTGALATFLSNRLYLYRLKPLYAQNVVAGLNAEGANRALS